MDELSAVRWAKQIERKGEKGKGAIIVVKLHF